MLTINYFSLMAKVMR